MNGVNAARRGWSPTCGPRSIPRRAAYRGAEQAARQLGHAPETSTRARVSCTSMVNEMRTPPRPAPLSSISLGLVVAGHPPVDDVAESLDLDTRRHTGAVFDLVGTSLRQPPKIVSHSSKRRRSDASFHACAERDRSTPHIDRRHFPRTPGAPDAKLEWLALAPSRRTTAGSRQSGRGSVAAASAKSAPCGGDGRAIPLWKCKFVAESLAKDDGIRDCLPKSYGGFREDSP